MEMKRLTNFMFMAWLAISGVLAQTDIITVTGIVTDENNEPVIGAYVLENDNNKTITDADGKYSINVNSNAAIQVSYMGYEKGIAYANGKNRLDFKLRPSNTLLPEITITSMMDKNAKFIFTPSEMEVVKDQVFLKTRYKIPDKLFFKDSRIVLHPYLMNYTRKTKKAYTPIVYDGVNYDILIKRGNVCGDMREKEYYSQFAKVIGQDYTEELINYADSCEIMNINDKYATEVYIKISTFCRDEYRDTLVIAQGIVFPMRHFEFDGISYELDNTFAPKQEILKFNEKGVLNLRFRPEEYKIYEYDGANAKELSKLRNILQNIDRDTTKTLTYLSVKGFTSPDGSLKRNEFLSKKRVQSAVDAITKVLSQDARQHVKIEYEGIVVPWEEVYQNMLKDSVEGAYELKKLIDRARGKHDEVSWGYRRLKCANIIRNKYLPKFRKVEYVYKYEERRTLNDEEVNELYAKDKNNLTSSEYWRYIYNNRDTVRSHRIQLMREALELHPDLMIAANNMVALLNREHKPDTTVLKPFMTQEAPVEVFINQAVAYFLARDFNMANAMVSKLPVNEKTKEVRAMAAAMNGHYDVAMEYYNNKECLNKAILLLCMRKNQEAYKCVKNIDDQSAEADYVRAIAANRNNDLNSAITFLKQAIAKKPELRNIIEVDGDVLDLKDFIKE